MNHHGTKVLETDRLILRPFRLDDADAMFRNWCSDSEVTKYLTWPTHASVNVSSGVLEDWVSSYEKRDFYQWAITVKAAGDEPIGSISIVRQDDRISQVHVGYCIGSRWWGQGITAEALASLIDFFFNEVKANRIDSRHDPRNPNSGKVMLKCGLQYEGTVRKGDWNNQGVCDYSMYGILAEDYFKS